MACVNCSDTAKRGLKFCPSCGDALEHHVEHAKPLEKERDVRPVRSKKMSKSAKAVLLTVGLLVVAGGAYYGLATQWFTVEATTNKVRDAIRSGDATLLAEHTEFNGKPVDQKMAQRFLDALKETPEQKKSFMDYLLMAGVSIQAENESDVPGQIVASGRQLGIFKDYRLRLDSVKTEVISNFKGTKVTLVNPVGTESSKASAEGIMMDGVYPGLTDAKIAYDGEYGKESSDVTINPLTLDAADRKYEITLKGNAVELDQTYPDAFLIVDGKSTSERVSDLKNYGPIPKNGIKLSIENSFPWGEETSGEVVVKPDTKKAMFTFEPSENVLNQLQEAVEQHASDWVDAATYQDTSYFSLVDDASYLAKQQKNYDDWSRKDLEWDGEFMNASIDRPSAKFVEYGDSVGIEVMATTYIRGEMYTPDSESPGKTTSKSLFRYLFTYESSEDSYEESFRIQQATSIK
ncbi:TcaA 3rd/4th domain-containing protein [Exiguobacterium acetylicum]|uniref:TcaA 3rd/4th domain-containing protein n=1 Tax=Exiguobacterium acetylicum TaxID=41170 RepID=UPI00301AC2D6